MSERNGERFAGPEMLSDAWRLPLPSEPPGPGEVLPYLVRVDVGAHDGLPAAVIVGASQVRRGEWWLMSGYGRIFAPWVLSWALTLAIGMTFLGALDYSWISYVALFVVAVVVSLLLTRWWVAPKVLKVKGGRRGAR